MKHHSCAVFFSLVALTSFASAQISIVNDDMEVPNYTSFSFSSFDNPDDISFESFSYESSGGNPDAVLTVFHDHDVERDFNGDPINGDGSSFLQSLFRNQGTYYNPGTQGAIQSLSFSVDYRTTEPFFTDIYFGVSEGGGGSFAGFAGPGYTVIADGNWHTYTVSGLVESDFSGRSFSALADLDFGFGFISYTDVTIAPVTFQIDADNFNVSMIPVPEPSSATLALLGLAIAARRRRS